MPPQIVAKSKAKKLYRMGLTLNAKSHAAFFGKMLRIKIRTAFYKTRICTPGKKDPLVSLSYSNIFSTSFWSRVVKNWSFLNFIVNSVSQMFIWYFRKQFVYLNIRWEEIFSVVNNIFNFQYYRKHLWCLQGFENPLNMLIGISFQIRLIH